MAVRNSSSHSKAMTWLLTGGSLVTLVIWSNLADPFNAPKSWVLYVSGFYLAGWVAFQIKEALRDSVLRVATILSGVYVLVLFLSFLFTKEKYVGFFGENARRTGFLTYFILTVFFLASALLLRTSNLSKFNFVTLIVGPLVGLYGFLQHFKIDAIKWNNPYNSVLSTLGNPDFASAVMGIFVVLLLGVVLNSVLAVWVRVYAATSIVFLGLTIVFSQARQGLLAAAIGVGIVVIVWLSQKNRIAALGASFLGLVVFVVGVLGMLNDGPLAKYLYKVSVTYRGDYWRAGMNMFKHHLWFGVGLDRYGAYFRQYRDATQSLRRGPDIISNAAHNVPIQLAATGGIFVLLVFILLFAFVVWRGVVAIRKASGAKQLVIASFVGAWATYEAQSFISIDNVGIAIWGWILGGVVVGLSVVEKEAAVAESAPVNVKNSKHASVKKPKPVVRAGARESIAQPVVSGVAATAALALVIPLFLADSAARLSNAYAKPTSQQMSAYVTAVQKPLEYGLVDPHNKVLVGTLLAQAGQIDTGVGLLNQVAHADPRNYEALNVLASIYEQTNRVAVAVGTRRQMYALDPYNYKNLLQLGKDLKATGDIAGAKAIVPLITAFAASTPEAAQAKREFGA
jgi:O-antigen ligase